MRLRDHEEDELSHYSNATTDIEFKFPFGWGELWGVADRTDFDLKQHMEHSGEDFTYIDPVSNERYVPYCIEPSLGADRVTLAFLCDAYDEEELEGDDKRTVLRFHPALAPFKAAVLPLSKSFRMKLQMFGQSFVNLSQLTLTSHNQSVNVTVVKMKLVHHSVSLTILTQKRMVKLQCVIAIQWIKFVCQLQM